MRSDGVWESWISVGIPLGTVIKFCEQIALEGGWPNHYFLSSDSFSLLCHDWGALSRAQIDYDILNAACISLCPSCFQIEKGFLNSIIKSLFRHGDIPCLELPGRFVDWSLLQFMEFVIKGYSDAPSE
jgi:hypothetical protein